MTSLTDFLLARLAEDVERAENERDFHKDWPDQPGCGLCDPARVLAECEAKRAIVAEHGPGVDCGDKVYGSIVSALPAGWVPVEDGTVIARQKFIGCRTLMHLAQPYSDHPDFDGVWRVNSATPHDNPA